jgi:hypothetical protein
MYVADQLGLRNTKTFTGGLEKRTVSYVATRVEADTRFPHRTLNFASLEVSLYRFFCERRKSAVTNLSIEEGLGILRKGHRVFSKCALSLIKSQTRIDKYFSQWQRS